MQKSGLPKQKLPPKLSMAELDEACGIVIREMARISGSGRTDHAPATPNRRRAYPNSTPYCIWVVTIKLGLNHSTTGFLNLSLWDPLIHQLWLCRYIFQRWG